MESFTTGLNCRECGKSYPKKAIAGCELCFAPLEVTYDYELIKKTLSKDTLAERPRSIWRYRELLPIEGESIVGKSVGYTPLIEAKNLAREWKLKRLFIKNDSVCFPSLSFKDRVVSVALTRALEFGYEAVGCSSTGNLANAVAALAATVGLKSYVFIPADLELGKIINTLAYGANLVRLEGNYDEVNRLCTEIVEKYPWGFVNVNLRPYYAEGSKTFAYEIAEQLEWQLPDNIIVPMAGGSLITKIGKAFSELERLGWVGAKPYKLFGVQASGCAPIASAVKQRKDNIVPVKPDTIARSLAIGNPADGYYALKTIVRSGGWAEDVSDREIVDGISLLARTEGIFTETAGGVTIAATKKLVDQGRIKPDELTVISITGNGLKTQEALTNHLVLPVPIKPKISAFESYIENKKAIQIGA